MKKWLYLNGAIVLFALCSIVVGYQDYSTPKTLSGIVIEKQIGPWQVKLMSDKPVVAGETITFYAQFLCGQCLPNFQSVTLSLKHPSNANTQVELRQNLSRWSGVFTLPENIQKNPQIKLEIKDWHDQVHVALFPMPVP